MLNLQIQIKSIIINVKEILYIKYNENMKVNYCIDS